MPRSIRVKDYMDAHPPSIHCDTPVVDVINLLLESRVSGLPVVDDHNVVLGYVSEKDCIHRILADSYYCEPTTQVKTLIHGEPLKISPQDNIVDIAESMQLGNKPDHYPVVDEDGKLVGLMRRSDILRALADEMTRCH